MESAQNGAVAALSAALRQVGKEGLERYIAQNFAAADRCHSAAVSRDGGILVGQVGVVCTGIQDAEREAGLGEIDLHRLDHGVGRVGKINGDDVAHAGSHLVHQAAGLAEVDVLCPLADLGDGDGGDLFGHEAVVQDDADQHLEGGRGRDAAALGHVGGNVDIQTGEAGPALLEGLALAAQDGGAGVFLFLAGRQVGQVDDAQVIALALDAQLVQAVGGGGCDHINVDAAGQHTAVLVVGVVAADLGAAGGTVQPGLGVGTKRFFQPVQHSSVAGCLCGGLFGGAAVQRGQTLGVGAACQLLLPDRNGFHHGEFLL